jgi:hypothetical protein
LHSLSAQGFVSSVSGAFGGGGGCIRKSINFQTATTRIITAAVASQSRLEVTAAGRRSTKSLRQRVDPLGEREI